MNPTRFICASAFNTAILTIIIGIIITKLDQLYDCQIRYLAKQYGLHRLAEAYLDESLHLDEKFKVNPLIEDSTRKVLQSIRDEAIANRKRILEASFLELLENYLVPRHSPTRKNVDEKKEREEEEERVDLPNPKRRQGKPDPAVLQRIYLN